MKTHYAIIEQKKYQSILTGKAEIVRTTTDLSTEGEIFVLTDSNRLQFNQAQPTIYATRLRPSECDYIRANFTGEAMPFSSSTRNNIRVK